MVTPLDVFRNYRDQTERTSFKVVPVVVDAFADKRPRAERTLSSGEFFEKYKNSPARTGQPDTPGFKVPRRVQVEYLGIDSNAVAKRASRPSSPRTS